MFVDIGVQSGLGLLLPSSIQIYRNNDTLMSCLYLP